MAQGRETLKVAKREEFGSREGRRLRRAGFVPGVLYAGGADARPFQVGEREIRTFLTNGHTLFDLEIEGSAAVPVVVKEQQHHPVRGDLLHIDCLEVKLDEAIQAEVALELEGAEEAPGVKEGGVLEHVTREITVEALPADIPEVIHADVSEMVIGDTLQLASLRPPSGVEFMADDPEEVTVATLSPPRIEEEPEPELEEEAELVGEEGEVPEGEAPAAEGEAPAAEGEAPAAEGEGGDGGEE
jgi:large subunit ribosomal protein L25